MVATFPAPRRTASAPILGLQRIYLHNWHRFSDHQFDVVDSLYLAGHNGSGKSSILEAIQMLLLADLLHSRVARSQRERHAAWPVVTNW